VTQVLQAIESGKDAKFVVVAHGYSVFAQDGSVKFSPLALAVCDKVEELYKSGNVEHIILLGGHDIPAKIDATIADRMQRQLCRTRGVPRHRVTTQCDFRDWERYVAPRDLVEEVVLLVQLISDLRLVRVPVVSVIGDLWIPRARRLYDYYGIAPTFAPVPAEYTLRQRLEEFALRALAVRDPLGEGKWTGRHLKNVRRTRTPRLVPSGMYTLLRPKP